MVSMLVDESMPLVENGGESFEFLCFYKRKLWNPRNSIRLRLCPLKVILIMYLYLIGETLARRKFSTIGAK